MKRTLLAAAIGAVMVATSAHAQNMWGQSTGKSMKQHLEEGFQIVAVVPIAARETFYFLQNQGRAIRCIDSTNTGRSITACLELVDIK